MEKCVVCKQELDLSTAVKTENGLVHYCECHKHVENMPVVENDYGNCLNETELLL